MPTGRRTRAGDRGGAVPPNEWPRWLDRYIKHLEAKGQAEKTLTSRRALLGKFIVYARQAGVQAPERVSTSLLRAYLLYRKEVPNSRRRRDKPRTVNSHILAVRRFIEFLLGPRASEALLAPFHQ